MSYLKIKITNPEAIKLLADIKSGVYFAPFKQRLITYKWYIISGLVVLTFIIALIIGKVIARRTPGEVFTPPNLETPIPTTEAETKSKYEPLRQEIIYFNSDLPDPVIPPFDNSIDLEPPVL